MSPATRGRELKRAFAWMCVVIGFPVPLLVLPFRFVVWLLDLFGIGKRKPQAAPVPQMKVTVEWGDDPATDKQLGFIRHLGGNPPDGLTKSFQYGMAMQEKCQRHLPDCRKSIKRISPRTFT